MPIGGEYASTGFSARKTPRSAKFGQGKFQGGQFKTALMPRNLLIIKGGPEIG
jgi:hypothetical protein